MQLWKYCEIHGAKKWLHDGTMVMFAMCKLTIGTNVVHGRRLFLSPWAMCIID